jgi:hypothetical protein
MNDNFKNHSAGLDSPAEDGEAVVNDVEFSKMSRALYVGGAGHVVVLMKNGSEVVFSSVPAGTILPIRAKRVLTQGVGSPAAATTTATLITAMW